MAGSRARAEHDGRRHGRAWVVAGVVAIGVTAAAWFAALVESHPEPRKALIGVAGALTAAVVGAACGIVSATWSDRLQRDREQLAERRAALREVRYAVRTYDQERHEAHRFRIAAKDLGLDAAARAQADHMSVNATMTAFAARAQALAAVRRAHDVVPGLAALTRITESINRSRMDPDAVVDEVLTDELAAELTGGHSTE